MELKFEDVDNLCTGAAFLGAGGGGDPYIGGLMVKQELAAGRKIEIIDPDELDDGKLIIPTAMMGAPTVLRRSHQVKNLFEPCGLLKRNLGGRLTQQCRLRSVV